MMKQEAYTSKELTSCLKITQQAVSWRAKNEGWKSRKRPGRGGGHEWLVKSMPEGTRAAIAAAELAGMEQAGPGATGELVVPDWAYDKAKVRTRIVMEWRKYVDRAGRKKVKKLAAMAEFMALLEAGEIVPAEALKTLGRYSLKSIYRWDAQLREAGDNLEALADKHGKWTKGGARGCGQLGERAEGLLLSAWLMPNRPSMALAYRCMSAKLEQEGLRVPSYASARRFIERYAADHYDLVLVKRRGEKALRDEEGPYIARNHNILEVGDLLYSDGHTLNFDSINPFTGKPCRLTLIAWFDAKSRMPVGWEIMPEETTLAISSALYMAIKNLGKHPRAVYIDNGKAFRAKYFSSVGDFNELDGLYQRLGIHVHHSKAYAAQTKIIERFWGTFNEQCARLLPSYRGNSIDDKPAYLMRAEAYHKARHKDYVPSIQESAQIFAAFVAWYAKNEHRGLDGATPWAVFEPGRGPGVDMHDLDRQFLLRKKISPRRTGFSIGGVRFESDALYGLRKEVMAMYSWADMSRVELFEVGTGVRIGEAYPVEALNPLAGVFGNELDMQKVAQANKRQQALRRQTMKMAKELDGDLDALSALPWMRPAAERRMALHVNDKLPDAPAPRAAISEAEAAEIAAALEEARAKKALEPAYQTPFFASESEKYEYLFHLKHFDGVCLLADDESFMQRYEGSEQYARAEGRYKPLLALAAKQREKTA